MTLPEHRSLQGVAAWLKSSDAVLMNRAHEVMEFARPFTAMFVVPGDPGSPAKVFGSGAFVALGQRRFIFTAGHCVRDATQRDVLIPYPYSRVLRETTYALRRGYICHDSLDVGYFELPIAVWRTLEAEGNVFMSHRRLHVAHAGILADDDDYVLSGFPRALSVVSSPRVERLRFSIIATSVAGRRGRASSLSHLRPGIEALDLAIDDRITTIDLRSAGHHPVALPELEGMSGGPCWKGFVHPEPSAWNADCLRMVGVHIARVTAHASVDPGQWRFARSILVGHHLRLVAEDFPDLTDFILSTWPALCTWTEPQPSERVD